MTDASVVAVGTPQSFRQQVARAVEMGPDEVGWVQSATAAEELLINAFQPIDVLVLSPEVKEPDALGLAEFVGRQAPGTAMVLVRDHTWNGLLPAAMRAGIRDVVDMTQGTEELRDAVERLLELGIHFEPRVGGSFAALPGCILAVLQGRVNQSDWTEHSRGLRHGVVLLDEPG